MGEAEGRGAQDTLAQAGAAVGGARAGVSPAAGASDAKPGLSVSPAAGGMQPSTGECSGLAAYVRELLGSAACWRAIVALALATLAVQLMNRALFPLFDPVFTYARDVSISVSAIVTITLGILSLVRPHLMRPRALMLAMLAATLVGVVTLAAGLAIASPVVLAIGACLLVTGRAWASLSASLSAVRLRPALAVGSIALGVTLGNAADAIVRLAVPQLWCVVLLVVCVVVGLALAARPAGALIADIAIAPPGAELAVTRPASFLPLTSTLYVCLILVQAAFGFALRFGEVGGTPSFGSLALPFVAVLALVVVVLRGRLLADVTANVVLLALVAGFLLVVIGGSGSAELANGVLTVGTSLFGVLLPTVLVALAARNELAALSIVAWGQGLSALATTLGALFGTTANGLLAAGSHERVAALAALIVLLLVAYALFGLRGFSFEQTIAGVVPPEPDVDLERAGEEALAVRCAELSARFDLTPREAEVFEMLARGRNREHIEGALGVSRNTVKAHVKHVYAKLGIHSHQELIDLFERKDS